MAKIKNILSGYSYLSVYLLTLISLNLLLLNIPLAKVFGYEFSAINAIAITLLSGLYSISLIQKLKSSIYSTETFIRILISAFSLFLIIPALISITNSFLTINCSLKDGIAFYLVITFPSVLTGLFFAVVSLSLLKKFPRILFVVIFLSILAVPLFEFYFNPQVYFYNPIFGFFPGTIYDEGLSVSNKLILYKIINSVYFGTGSFLILLAILKAGKWLKKIFVILSILVAVIFYCLSPMLGFATTFGSLEKKLGGKVTTEHFNIYYPLTLEQKKVEALVLYHEYFYSQLKIFFGYDVKDKLNSFIFSDDVQKKELFGSANADVAKPWLNSTFISAGDYHNILKHEIAHCYSGQFGTGILKVAHGLNPFLIEGIAVAADPVFDDNNIDFMASLAYSYGYKISINSMLNNFSFYTQASSVSYIYAGSFTKYMVEHYGINKFKKFYEGGNFFDIYGIKLAAAEKEYYKYLESYGETGNRDEANYYFGRKSIFYKVCPRYISDRLEEAWRLFNQNNIIEAEKIFKEILGKTNNYSAVIGYAECLSKLNKKTSAVKVITGWLEQFKNTAYYYNLELQQADLMVENGNYIQADSVYSDLKRHEPSRILLYLADLRLTMINDTSTVKQYLEGSDFDKYLILKKINEKKYIYSSFPVMINLSSLLNEGYDLFIKDFDKPIEADDYLSSYAIYKLSVYMLDNLDYSNARKTAAMALRYVHDKNFNSILKDNYDKCEWILLHHNEVLANTKFAAIK